MIPEGSLALYAMYGQLCSVYADVGTGCYVKAVAFGSEREPVVLGKPHPPMMKVIQERSGVNMRVYQHLVKWLYFLHVVFILTLLEPS